MAWKKGKIPFPDSVRRLAEDALAEFFAGFDVATVPAPSFHDYGDYPIWPIAEELAEGCGLELARLFPEKSGKTRMGWHGSLQKRVQSIDLDPGQFVLIIDDIYTTGHTFRVSCEAVIARGSFPCCLALC